jgi:cytochrome oxidase Cu insertion factor (SCO1/SenC/PrrC family)
MNFSKVRMLLWSACVVSSGVILGTMLWVKFAPKTVYRDSSEPTLEGLNRFGAVPDFSLVERSGKKAGLGDLRGKIWIADFIYTNCTDTCPLQTAAMAKLQERWMKDGHLKLVSFSVDPERDTPEVLSRYAERYKADEKRWWFLTGAKEQITRLVQDGFRLSAVPATEDGAQSSLVFHSSRFVLVDQEAQIRGYYDSRDPEALGRLNRDVTTLLSTQRSSLHGKNS